MPWRKGRCDVRKLVQALAVIFMATLLAACAPQQQEQVSSGQTDQVPGFIFVSDTRPATIALVEAMDSRQLPVRASYDFGKPTTITDPAQIRKLYIEMSGLILIGQAPQYGQNQNYYVEFELADGTIARFDFTTKNHLHIGDQDYMIESGSAFYKLVEA